MSHVVGRNHGQDVKIPFTTRELQIGAAVGCTLALAVTVAVGLAGNLALAVVAGAVTAGCFTLGFCARGIVEREIAAAYRATEPCCTPSGLSGRILHAMGDCQDEADRG